jgi:hypothetical protein
MEQHVKANGGVPEADDGSLAGYKTVEDILEVRCSPSCVDESDGSHSTVDPYLLRIS